MLQKFESAFPIVGKFCDCLWTNVLHFLLLYRIFVVSFVILRILMDVFPKKYLQNVRLALFFKLNLSGVNIVPIYYLSERMDII